MGSAQNEPTWHNTSLSTYNSWIRSGRTGAKSLNLPLITVGGSNPDLVRRPGANEDTSNPVLFGERLFTKASIRILLSDTAADLTGLALLKTLAPDYEMIQTTSARANRQMTRALASGVGLASMDQYDLSGPSVASISSVGSVATRSAVIRFWVARSAARALPTSRSSPQ